jgi:hypothetical protein
LSTGEFLFLLIFSFSWAALLLSRNHLNFINLASLYGRLRVFIVRSFILRLRLEDVEVGQVAVTQDLKGSLTSITPLRFQGRAYTGSTMSITMVERRKMGNPLTHRFGCQTCVTSHARVTHAMRALSNADFGGFVMEDCRDREG